MKIHNTVLTLKVTFPETTVARTRKVQRPYMNQVAKITHGQLLAGIAHLGIAYIKYSDAESLVAAAAEIIVHGGYASTILR